MTWSYRLIRKKKKNPIKGGKPRVLVTYDLHEVYYRKDGTPYMWTAEPIAINGYEKHEEVVEVLTTMLKDVLRWPPLQIKGRKLTRIRK